jgi:TldD protein
MEPDRGQLKDTLDLLLSTGAEFAEVFLERRTRLALVFEDRRLDDASCGIDAGVGLRIIHDDVTYYANGNDHSSEAILSMARGLATAIASSRRFTAQPFVEPSAPPRSTVLIPPESVDIETRLALLRRADTAARARDPRVTQVTVSLRDVERRTTVANSEGTFATDTTCYVTMGVLAVAREGGILRSGFEVKSETSGFELFERETPEAIAGEAARVAVLQLTAKPAPAGTFTVVLSSSAGGTMVHEACGHVFEGDFIQKGLSAYAGKLGQKVASELVTVFDDGTIAQKRGTNRIDDEGTPVSKVILIENGILRGFLHDRRSARALGMRPTGNGRRESYRHLPAPRMRNTCVAPGTTPAAEIIRSVKDGIFVANIGGGEVDIVAGNFVFLCSEAYRIRDGEIREAIRDATLTGNGPDILRSIDAVGDDLGFNVGNCGKDGQTVPVANAQPTIRIPAIVVGGTA